MRIRINWLAGLGATDPFKASSERKREREREHLKYVSLFFAPLHHKCQLLE